jgi:hypothetical protein
MVGIHIVAGSLPRRTLSFGALNLRYTKTLVNFYLKALKSRRKKDCMKGLKSRMNGGINSPKIFAE